MLDGDYIGAVHPFEICDQQRPACLAGARRPGLPDRCHRAHGRPGCASSRLSRCAPGGVCHRRRGPPTIGRPHGRAQSRSAHAGRRPSTIATVGDGRGDAGRRDDPIAAPAPHPAGASLLRTAVCHRTRQPVTRTLGRPPSRAQSRSAHAGRHRRPIPPSGHSVFSPFSGSPARAPGISEPLIGVRPLKTAAPGPPGNPCRCRPWGSPPANPNNLAANSIDISTAIELSF